MTTIELIRSHSRRLLLAAACTTMVATAQAQSAPPTTSGVSKSIPDKPLRVRDPAALALPVPSRQSSAPPPSAAPPPVPVVKASVDLSSPYQFLGQGYYADVVLVGGGLDVMNFIRLVPGGWVRIGITPKHSAAFPSGNLNLVITGRGDGRIGNLTMRSDTNTSRTVSCPIPRGSAWRCSLALPVGVIGQQQQVSLSASDAGTTIEVISVE
jgi:hypothetical protein